MVSGKQAKQQRREEMARRYSQNKRGFRLSTGWIIGIVAVVIFGGLLSFVAFDSIQSANQRAAVATDQTPANTINDGWTVTASGVSTATPYPAEQAYTEQEVPEKNLTMYIDYDCPSCGTFERNNGEQIQNWLEDGTLDSISIHPMAFVSEYSLQAFNAMSCVADRNPASLLETHMALMTNQPGGVGMDEDTLTELLRDAGNPVDDAEFAACVETEAFTPFIESATMRAQQGPLPAAADANLKVEGTPTILINGQRYSGDPTPAVLEQAVKGGGISLGGPVDEEETTQLDEQPADQ